MSEYTPTAKTVEAFYCHAWQDITGSVPGDHSSHEEFERWLNSVKAEAWDEGADFQFVNSPFPSTLDKGNNPYRTGGAE